MPNGTMTTTIQLALGGAVHSKSFTAPTGGRCMVRVACWVRARLAAGFGLGGLRGSGSVGCGVRARARVGGRVRVRARVTARARAEVRARAGCANPTPTLP